MPGTRDRSSDRRESARVTLPPLRDILQGGILHTAHKHRLQEPNPHFQGKLLIPPSGSSRRPAYSLAPLHSILHEPHYPTPSTNPRHGPQSDLSTSPTVHDYSYEKQSREAHLCSGEYLGAQQSISSTTLASYSYRSRRSPPDRRISVGAHDADKAWLAYSNGGPGPAVMACGHHASANEIPSTESSASTHYPVDYGTANSTKKKALQFQPLPPPRSHLGGTVHSSTGSPSDSGSATEYSSPYGVLIAELDPKTTSYSDPQRLAIIRTLRSTGGVQGTSPFNVDDVLITARYECPYCTKRFTRPSSLKIHINSHTGEKPFKCPESGCGRRFSVQSNMRRHAKVHPGGGSKGGESSAEDEQCDNNSYRLRPI